jgi:phosphate transport system ATP-binding protein
VTTASHDDADVPPENAQADLRDGQQNTAHLPAATAAPAPADAPPDSVAPDVADAVSPDSADGGSADGAAPDVADGGSANGAAPEAGDGALPGSTTSEPAARPVYGPNRRTAPAADPPAQQTAVGGFDMTSFQPPADGLLGLEARNVAAWFGDHKVLEGVSLNMEPGKVTALIGPSGCGKSTFLRILNRMHELVRSAALAGEVLLGGEDIYDPRQRPADVRRRIGMVFQKPNPFPAMSIYDNVASGLKLAGIKARNKDALVETSLRRAGLWNEVQRRLRSPGGALSGGQQQRLCIARALAISPEVLLMDEPCSALDPTSTRRIEETIRELAGEVTIVIVTHNMQQAQRVSENCAFFLAAENTPGYIVESGPTEKLFDDPADPRTADYVHGRFG